jgi:hypothetical protein
MKKFMVRALVFVVGYNDVSHDLPFFPSAGAFDKNTQQNAALVEETTAAAGALKSQTETLQE